MNTYESSWRADLVFPAPGDRDALDTTQERRDIQERLNWAEEPIRQLTKGRGMRVGRALRRLYPEESADTIGALARLWDPVSHSFRVTVATTQDEWETAYASVRSCMSQHAGLMADAYQPHGVQLVYAMGPENVPSARILIGASGLAAPKAYGVASHSLSELLRVVLGIQQSDDWLDGVQDISVRKFTRRKISQSIMEIIAEKPAEVGMLANSVVDMAQLHPGTRIEIAPSHVPGHDWMVRAEIEKRTYTVEVHHWDVVFRPYLDGYAH